MYWPSSARALQHLAVAVLQPHGRLEQPDVPVPDARREKVDEILAHAAHGAPCEGRKV